MSIVLSILQFTDADYSLNIFKLFLLESEQVKNVEVQEYVFLRDMNISLYKMFCLVLCCLIVQICYIYMENSKRKIVD